MYRYIQDRNMEFEKANFDEPDYFKRCNLPVLFVCDAEGNVVWGRVFDLETMNTTTLASLPQDKFPETHTLRQSTTEDGSVVGIMLTERGPMMVCSRQIVKSNLEGPAVGRIIFGRFLDAAALEQLSAQTSVKFATWSEGELPDEARAEVSALKTSPKEAIIRDGNSDALAVYRLVPGVRDEDSLVLRSSVPRDITAAGKTTMTFGRLSMIGAAGFTLLLLVTFLQTRIVGPLTRLTRHATNVSATADLTSKLDMDRNDEIGTLANEFNLMIGRLAESQASLARASRQAGMAEVADSVLHNVGNALNNVAVTAGVMRQTLAGSRAAGFSKVAALLRQHENDLAAFLTTDQKGAQIPRYLIKAADDLSQERDALTAETVRLEASLQHIQEIIRAQQSVASGPATHEPAMLSTLLSQVRMLVSPSYQRHGITLTINSPEDIRVALDSGKLQQILVNLLTNAKQAMEHCEPSRRAVSVTCGCGDGDRFWIEVRDRGAGMLPEAKENLFKQGFTTRKDGHGLGLHYCAVSARQMGGSITADSDGQDMGAVFRLELPRVTALQRAAA